MKIWSDGYLTELEFPHGYQGELNPLHLRWALLNAGRDPGRLGLDGSTVCELGFGQGISINIHAASQPGQWWGTDFNLAHVASARQLANASGADLHLHQDAFSAFARRTDLPRFDCICLHGVWTWVSDDNRRVIVDFIRSRLAPGGVVYCSYNALPGWASALPLRELLLSYATSSMAAGQGILESLDSALRFAQQLVAVNPATAQAIPMFASQLALLSAQNRNYLAHEIVNGGWQPMAFGRIAEWLALAELEFAGSAALLDEQDGINLDGPQAQLVASVVDPVLRETVRDLCVNKQFRRDIWVRQARRLSDAETAAAMASQFVVLLHTPDVIQLEFDGPRGRVSLNPAVYRPVIDALAAGHPRQIGDLGRELASRGIGWAMLREALTMLVTIGVTALAQIVTTRDAHAAAARRLNTELLRMSQSTRHASHLASPVTGGGIAVPRLEQLFLLARSHGLADSARWAEFALATLRVNGERLAREGIALSTREAEFQELALLADRFARLRLPVLERLGVA